jgi:pimeloyl-ACP methyl ester carboxylesterase
MCSFRAEMRVTVRGLGLEYETFGSAGAPPVLLIAGFSQQLTSWDPLFCEGLAARGFFVVRFDNRDVGLSTKLDGAPRPKIPAILSGDLSSMAYGIEDMADDAAGLVDALGLGPAHLVGVSMGGMIAQSFAIRHAARVRSLVSIMSTPGDRSVGQPMPDTVALVMQRAPTEREENVDHGVRVWQKIRLPGFTHDEAQGRERIARSFDRCFHPQGVARQAGAIMGQRDRTADLANVRVPVAVIHGAEDTLIHRSGGEATARAIPGAKLTIVPGMGHDLPAGVWPFVLDAIASTADAR